jgi:hypothetical protein
MTKATGHSFAKSFRASARALVAPRGSFLLAPFSTFGKALVGHIGRIRRPPTGFVNPIVATPTSALIRAAARQVTERPQPTRPAFFRANSPMCEAQRLDLKAAREGRITWQQYFAMWGTLSL